MSDHLAALIKRYAKLGSCLRAAIDATGEAGDADTNESTRSPNAATKASGGHHFLILHL